MSAIFGILRFDGNEVASAELARLQTALKHRTLDGAAHEALGPIGLGACVARDVRTCSKRNRSTTM